MTRFILAHTALAAFLLAGALHASPAVSLQSDGKRLDSLTVAGKELLTDNKDLHVFDRSDQGYRAVPFTASIMSGPDEAGVDFTLHVTIPADRSEPVTRLEVDLPPLAVGPVKGLGPTESRYAGGGDVPVCQAGWTGGEWYVCDLNAQSDDAQARPPAPRERWQIRLGPSNRGPTPVTLTNYAKWTPGQEYTLRFRYRFAPPGTPVYRACRETINAWVKTHPKTIRWNDHRPIGTLMLATVGKSSPRNPGAYCADNPYIDVATKAGRAELRKALMFTVRGSIANMRSLNGQGITIWDLEGAEHPRSMYIGCPQALPEISPVVDGFADEMFATIRQAGLKAGVCVRDAYLQTPAEGHDFVQRPYRSEEERKTDLFKKIDYAVKRWGVELIYLDSWAGTPDTLQFLSESFPKVLISPEIPYPNPFQYLYTAPFSMANTNRDQTPEAVREYLPHAKTLLYVGNQADDNSQREREIMNGVMHGDILGVRAWWKGGSDWKIARRLRGFGAW